VRVRIIFAKNEVMRYTSHLDLYRTWERTLRRAHLPLEYSQGYKPHPKINIATALPLGFTSKGDIVDIWLSGKLDLAQIQTLLTHSLPPGLKIENILEVEAGAPSLQSQIRAAQYSIELLAPIQDIEQKINLLLASPDIIRIRNNKEYDLRPLILGIKLDRVKKDHIQKIEVTLLAKESATGRPEEIIRALGGDPNYANVQRERLIFSDT
jgi:radical SAM-linked protein